MTATELQLRETIAGNDWSAAIDAAVSLYRNFLSIRGDYVEAELVLLSVLGLQSTANGFIIELTLGEIYIEMNELSRAKRFLETAQASSQEFLRQRASELLAGLENRPPEG